jgi:hypothetical protein
MPNVSLVHPRLEDGRPRIALPGLVVARAAVALGCAATVLYVGLSTPTSSDYNVHGAVSVDNAGPAINALVHGNLGGFVSRQPLMGLLSLLLRVPFAWVAGALGGGPMLGYRLGALACLLPLALLAGWLAADSGLGRVTAAGIVAAGVVLLGSPTVAAIGWGHPEEVLAATLATGALVAATCGRVTLAGVLVGGAIGTKEWALIALVPALMALPTGRLRATATAAATAFLLAATAPLLDPAAFTRASHALGNSRLVTALSAWWPLGGRPASIPGGAPLAATLPAHLTKATALPLVLAVVLAIAVLLAWLSERSGARLRVRGRVPDAFALLCLLALVRCIADPGPVEYYYVAAVLPLAVWETVVLRRLPLAALLAVVAVRLTFGPASSLGPGVLSAITLIWTGALISYLGARTFWIGRPWPAALVPTGGD